MNKYLYLAIGTIAAALAIIGAYTPGLPTTVFVIIALWAYAKSSTRLYNWFRTIPILKQAIIHADNYQKHKAITRKVKIIAQTFAWSSFVMMVILSTSTVATVAVFSAALLCSIFMYATKTLPVSINS